MKFIYVDETGNSDQSDVFVMAGVMIDAYRLRKATSEFDKLLSEFLAKHPGQRDELKTRAFINGADGWSKVSADERKAFLKKICEVACSCGRIYAVAFSFVAFSKALSAKEEFPFKKSYWLAAALFLAGLVQKKGQGDKNYKGLTVFVVDDNKRETSNFSDALFEASPWFDALYQPSSKGLREDDRFSHIINSAFAIKSEHSSLVQIADAVAYVFRRDLELRKEKEVWIGEKDYYAQLCAALHEKRERLGRTQKGDCVDFFKAASHSDWHV